MNKIQKQVLDKAYNIKWDFEDQWIECFEKIVDLQYDTIPKDMIECLDIIDGSEDSDLIFDYTRKLIGEFITFDRKLIQNRTLRKEFDSIYLKWCDAFSPIVISLQSYSGIKFKSKAKTIRGFEIEIFIKMFELESEMLEQFQYDEYIMSKYPKKIRDIISVTGYAKNFTDKQDRELDHKIMDIIHYKIIDTHPDKKLRKYWDKLFDTWQHYLGTSIFLEDYMLEKEK